LTSWTQPGTRQTNKLFAAEFAEDTELINIVGVRIQGRAATARQMQHVFDVVFNGSHHVFQDIEVAQYLTDDLSTAEVSVPAGPRAPGFRDRQTFLLGREGDSWKVRHWHNTIVVFT
jgi:uncharacterized protein (TIGR02246 family)